MRTCCLILLSCSVMLQAAAQIRPNSLNSVPAAVGNQTPYKPADYSSSTTPLNYVRVYEPQQSFNTEAGVTAANRTVEEVRRTTRYFDGLGRLIQTVAWQQGTNKNDIVSISHYDDFGRESYKFLPFVSTDNTGNLKYTAFTQDSVFNANQYPGEKYFYSKTNYEPSPLNRAVESFAPGNSWAGSESSTANPATEHAVRTEYGISEANEVRIWTVTNDALTYNASTKEITASLNVPVSSAWYAAGVLYRTVMTDEGGSQVAEYKDKEGHVILKKVQISAGAVITSYTGWLSTYYVYDDLGQLRFVIPPKATEQLADPAKFNWNLLGSGSNYTLINELCFRYEYDSRQRMIAKKVPGADWTYLVYDDRDRLVYTQDGNLRDNGSWLGTLYDGLNRPVLTGLLTSGNFTHQVLTGNMAGLGYATTAATTVDGKQIMLNANPIPASATFIAQTCTHYDDYSWTSTAFDTSDNSRLEASATNLLSEQMPDVSSPLTTGMATGTEVRIIKDNPGTGTWLTNVTFYDDKAKPVQVNSTGYRSTTTKTTNLYDWAGKVISTLTTHKFPGAVPADTTVTTKRIATDYLYDHTGKVTEIKKRIFRLKSGNVEEVQTSRVVLNTYDAIGQLLTKSLGQKRSISNAYVYKPMQYIDSLTYSYNIRGWLKGINKNYTKTSSLSNDMDSYTEPWFAMELSYDWGFTASQFSGNIAGVKWRTRGDQKDRAFGYDYDLANRLIKGDYTQYNATWVQSVMDFSVSNLQYDANGNISSMSQKGMKLGAIISMDQLAYSYSANSNKLSGVKDTANDVNSVLGDFKYDAAKTGNDYLYDGNGNLTKDNNKNIASISYNYLNLPNVITVSNNTNGGGGTKGTISYVYDALGNKLEKVTDETAGTANQNTAVKTTTTYLGAFTYQKTEKTISGAVQPVDGPKMQFFAQEEGRVRESTIIDSSAATPVITTNYFFDYFEKDHLGNVRVVLTDEVKKDVYPAATVEKDNTAALAVEKGYYDIKDANIWDNKTITNNRPNSGFTYPNNNGNPPYNTNPYALTDSTTKYGYWLNGTAAGNRTGLGITLKVMAGDTVNIFGKSYYYVGSKTVSNSYPVSSALLSLLTSFTGGSAVSGKGVTGTTLNSNTATTTPLTSLVNSTPAPTGNKPKAGINWILFDEQFIPVSKGFSAVSTNSDEVYTHPIPDVPVKANGYLFVYCSDESNLDVFFDNLQVIHAHGPLLEETHYYPFGLTIAGLSSKEGGIGEPENNKKYNGIEFDDNLDIDEYEAFYRDLDPQTGRWWQIDPKLENQESLSPYNAMANDPIKNSDPLGDEDCCKTLWHHIQRDINITADQLGLPKIFEDASSAARTFNTYVNPLTPVVELATGKSVVSDLTQDKSRWTSAGEVLMVAMPIAKAEGTLAKVTEAAMTSTSEKSAGKDLITQVNKALTNPENAGKAAVIGGKLPNGASAVASSAPPPIGTVATSLQQGAEAIGGIGNTGPSGKTIGCCAEFHVANQLLLDNPQYKPTDINFTPAIRPRTGAVVPRCTNCTAIFGPEHK